MARDAEELAAAGVRPLRVNHYGDRLAICAKGPARRICRRRLMKPELLEPIIEVSPPPPPRRLSNDLKDLLVQARGRSLSLGELEEILQGRGFALFILLLALPFSFPI